jgi:hypothetical protein
MVVVFGANVIVAAPVLILTLLATGNTLVTLADELDWAALAKGVCDSKNTPRKKVAPRKK